MTTNGARRLVIVDDDEDLTLLLKDTFEAEGYHVAAFFNALQLLRYVRENGLPHLAMIDLRMPQMHGFELSEKLKAMGDVPIVFISAQGEKQTIIDGIQRYAEDYVTKPFEVRELVARVQRILSRITDFSYAQPPVIKIDDRLSIDFGHSRLLIHGNTTLLTPTEAGLLHILLRNAGCVVPNETLIARVWPAEEVYEETLRVHMHRLRRKLERDYRRPKYIETARGIGYRFIMERDPDRRPQEGSQASGAP
jgi:DNA-binding response OmpR family regulator